MAWHGEFVGGKLEMKLPWAVVLADDLTGANATGALLASYGFTVLILRAPEGELQALQDRLIHADVWIINLNTRHQPPPLAAEKVRKVIRWLEQHGIRLLAKRIDTTFRGPIGTEIQAILDILPAEAICVLTGAFPRAGRITIGGQQWINGVPLDQTEAARYLSASQSTAYIPALLSAQVEVRIGRIPIEIVRAGPGAVIRHIHAQVESDCRILCADAATEADLFTLAEALASSDLPVFTADPGPLTAIFASVLARREGYALVTPLKMDTFTSHSRVGPVLVVAGSPTALTQRQLDLLERHWRIQLVRTFPSRLLAESERDREQQRVLSELQATSASIVGIRIGEDLLPLQPAQMHQIVEILADICRKWLEGKDLRGLYATGGETVDALCHALGILALRIRREIRPLMVLTEALGGPWHGLPIVTKGGLVGGEDAAVVGVLALMETQGPAHKSLELHR